MVGPVYAAAVEKLKRLLESAWIHRPYTLPPGQAQMEAWARVRDDVWGAEQPKYDVQGRFSTLMGIPVKHQRTYTGWDQRMFQLHAGLSEDYQRVKAPAQGSHSRDEAATHDKEGEEETAVAGGQCDEDERTGDMTVALPPHTDLHYPDEEKASSDSVSVAASEQMQPVKRRRLEEPAVVTELPSSGESMDEDWADRHIDPLEDERLVRAVALSKPHLKHVKAAWRDAFKSIRADNPRATSVVNVKRRFAKLLTLLADPTVAAEHLKLSSLLATYCATLRRRSKLMERVITVSSTLVCKQKDVKKEAKGKAPPLRVSSRLASRSVTVQQQDASALLQSGKRVLRSTARAQQERIVLASTTAAASQGANAEKTHKNEVLKAIMDTVLDRLPLRREELSAMQDKMLAHHKSCEDADNAIMREVLARMQQ